MSLHLGNLSSRIRRDDLERAFLRFGRCSIQVKDKYGFVVYDYPACAEKALKALRGKRICGEAITLSWSNKQPCAFQRFSRGGKLYEPPPRRNYSTKENVDRRLGSNDPRDYEIDYKQADNEGKNHGLHALVGESTSHNLDDSNGYVEAGDHTSLSDHNGIEGSGKNHLDPSQENILENGMEFDRYEPNHSDEKKESDEHQNTSPLVGSPSTRKSQEREGPWHSDCLEKEKVNYPYHPKSRNACYVCEESGHEVRNCPVEMKRLHPGGDNILVRRQDTDREPSTLRNHKRLLRSGDSPPPRITPRGRRKEFGGEKRIWKDNETQDKYNSKRIKRPPPSRPKSPSRSLRSVSRSPTKQVLLKKNSLSSSPRSTTSRSSAYKTLKSPSTSRLMSPTSSSLPIDLNRSPNERRTDSKDYVLNGLPQSKDLLEEEKVLRSTAGASENENTKLEGEMKKVDTHSDEGNKTAENLLTYGVKEIRDSKNDELVVREDVLELESDVSLRSNASSSAKMSSEEIYMVLKHYGLQGPEDNEKNLPVEVYFGSARSWPWEIIYYRRLKKGPISAENYARRVAQNEEFGIVDKYIRSSNGWGELNEDNS